jgi:hypothetical protein
MESMRSSRSLLLSMRTMLVVPIAVLLAWWMGAAVAGGGQRLAVALGIAGVALLLPLAAVAARLRDGIFALEVPVVLLLVSNLVIRGRTTQQLAANPLDAAGQFRVAFVALAGLLALAAFLSTETASQRLTSLPFRLYMAYTLVVFAGVPLSANAPLTAYRGVELATALLVFLGARKAVGEETTARIESTLYWCTFALVASVWLGVVLFPSRAIARLADMSIPIPYNLEGVYPSLASNAVGFLGAMLMLWSLARMRSQHGGRLRPRTAYTMAAVGLVTLVFAQYRTGYVAALCGSVLFLFIRRKWGLAGLLAAAIVTLLIWKPSLITTAEPYVLRGQTVSQAHQLSGRVGWWQAALPVWEESPLIGKGLLTATRFEIFSRLGDFTGAGLHSTWIEALVGTGVIGLGFLGLSFLITARRALVEAVRPNGSAVAIVILVVIAVRSLTGNTFESFQYEALVFLWIASSVRDAAAPLATGAR